MNQDRRKAVLGRFRAVSLDRIREVTLALIEIEGGRGGAALFEEVCRDLHTLKGDSRMIGERSIRSSFIHICHCQHCKLLT